MKQPAWSKKFEVLSISRRNIHEWGFVPEEIKLLDDEDMRYIAHEVQDSLVMIFNSLAKNTVQMRLAEKLAGKHI